MEIRFSIVSGGTITGSMSIPQNIVGTDTSDATVTPDALLSGITAYGAAGRVTGSIETYSGDYTITPMITSQRLETEDKYLTDDVTIHTIPTTETLNDAGGYTLKIG